MTEPLRHFLPTPPGPWGIGTQTRALVDRGRRDLFGDGGDRPLVVQAWYPTTAHGAASAYLDDPMLPDALEQLLGLPNARDLLAPLACHALPGAPPAPSRST